MIRANLICGMCLALAPTLLLANEAVTKVSVAQPLERESNLYDFPAQVESAPQVAVRAKVDGAVEKVLCKVGQQVKQGDVLLMLTTKELSERRKQLEGEFTKAEAAVTLAEQALQRASKDPKRQIDVPSLTAQRDLATVKLKVLQKELARLQADALHAAVTAPIDGVVVKMPVAPGEAVSSGASFSTLLCAIAQTNPIYVTFQLDERTLLYLRQIGREDDKNKAEPTRCTVSLQLANDDAFEHVGFAQCSDSRLDTKTGKIRFLAEFESNRKLAPLVLADDPAKQAATIRLSIGAARKVLLVPSAAIGFNENDEPQALVIDKKNIAQPKVVKLGPTVGGFQAITAGLAVDDWVIVGAERPVLDSPDQILSPADFATDIRALRVRPGSQVDPQRVKLNLPTSLPTTAPRTKESSPK